MSPETTGPGHGNPAPCASPHENGSGTLVIVLMGVTGAGKTTVGERLAAALGWPFHEGDTFHPPANVEKMTRGIGLSDDSMAYIVGVTDKQPAQRQFAGVDLGRIRGFVQRHLQRRGLQLRKR